MKSNTVKTAFKILEVSLFVILFNACSQGGDYNDKVPVGLVDISEEYQSIEKSQTPDSKPDVSESQLPKNLKIIKTANSRYKVESIKKATDDIKKMAFKYDAYISDFRFENDQFKKETRFTIKIPALHFDTMMDSIAKVSEFTDYENITTKDVTEEYVDLQSRLKTKMEVKERYELILRKNAKTVEGILATEEKLRVIQEEIESTQGRLNYLSNKVSYSTIQIDLYEAVDFKNEPIAYNKSFWSKTKEGLIFGWNFIESVVIGIIYIWPILISGILIFIYVRHRMKINKKG